MTKSHAAFKLVVAAVVACVASNAWPAAYRCDVDGKTIYSDRPCDIGRQSEVAVDSQGPRAQDRAAAAARLRNDKSELQAMQREREKRERTEPVSNRAISERSKQVNACSKLAVRARRAHEDYSTAGPREQTARRVRMLRADEDYAALCKKR